MRAGCPRRREPVGPARVTTYGTGVEDVDPGDRPADGVPLETDADHLDLGELGHGGQSR